MATRDVAGVLRPGMFERLTTADGDAVSVKSGTAVQVTLQDQKGDTFQSPNTADPYTLSYAKYRHGQK